MAETKVYDLKAVTMVLADIPITDGLGENDVLAITPEGDAFGDSIGGDGEVCRHATHERRYTLELTLMNSSKHHQQLAALHAADVSTTGGSGVGAGFVKDNNGATIMAWAQCWVAKAPDLTIAKERGESTWKFRAVASPATVIQGGN
jgi:hypothetical protein